MEIIDTMVFVHAFNEDSEYHKEALEMIKKSEIVLLFPQNLLEFYNVFSKLRNKEIAKRNIGRLIRISRDISYQNMLDFLLAVEISRETCLKIFDAMLVSSAIRRKLRLLTFDRRIKRVYEKYRSLYV